MIDYWAIVYASKKMPQKGHFFFCLDDFPTVFFASV